jgi:hypothetical protein
MKATKGGTFKALPLPEPQTVLARCYSMIDLGTQPNLFNGKPDPKRPFARKIYITWEFPTLLAVFNDDKGEEPFVVGKEYTASTGDKSNLGLLISRWRNKPLSPIEQEAFDPATMVGKTGYISFLHKRKKKYLATPIDQLGAITNENTALEFNGIMPKPKDIECPPNRNPYYIWDWDVIETEGFEKHKEHFEKMPKWLQRKCSESQEFKKFCGNYKVEGTAQDEPEAAGTGSAPKEQPKKVAGDDW